MNPQVVQKFADAWRAVRSGKADSERAILLFRKADGSLAAKAQGYTNEFDRFTLNWNPAAIAIFHTHRNSVAAEPAPADKEVANKLGVPIFTITSSGMYVYDPETDKVIKIKDGLDWLDLSKWQLISSSAGSASSGRGVRAGLEFGFLLTPGSRVTLS